MHLYEKKLNSKIILDGKIIKVMVDDVELENGKKTKREYLHHNGGVSVVPLTDKNEIIFVRQFRYPYGDVLLEIPAGKIDGKEFHGDCAVRELKEETGAVAEKYTYLGGMYPSAGYTDEIIHMYLAQGLTFENQKLDEDEFLDVVKIPIEKAIDMIMNNKLNDAKSQIAILKTARLLNL